MPRVTGVAGSRPPRIAICGKPNVGKSSLINALLDQERMLVSETPGTTRDSVDQPCQLKVGGTLRPYVLIDTAGMRHRRKMESPVECFSLMRAEKSVCRADLVVLVLEAAAGVTVQDKKIAGFVLESRKPLIIAVNKWDTAVEREGTGKRLEKLRKQYEEALKRELFFCDHAPVLFLSARTGLNLKELPETVARVEKELLREVKTPRLNRVVREALERQPPPAVRGRRLRVFYAVQKPHSGELSPPMFILFVNDPALMSDACRRYLEDRLRERFGFWGCPIFFELRHRGGGPRA